MSVQWTIIASFLYFEIGLVILFVLPIINPRKWQMIFNSNLISRVSNYSTVYFYIFLSVLMLFLVDAISDMRKYSKSSDTTTYGMEMKGSIKLFRAQRNFYITFFSIFLAFVQRRLVTMINLQATLINKSEAIIKEAETAKDLACKTVRDHENFMSIEKATQETILNTLKEQIQELTEKCHLENVKFKSLHQEYEDNLIQLQELKRKYEPEN